ncbi:TCR/Tet family MFS transporter [Pradoshia sp. D12]|uniref:MFS transporter n=1 Tax=Bacillaceae TaxID=186817 RepID=UPI00112CFD16|nr:MULTISPECIES: MFS transporter [Bacillaceae]QFK72741.1 TCR/Tet family MFS transporter [Pradoshia sp. D12]TPF71735.1 TCR/Tet family MFS transporter [Bacillus sp. D12]
MENKKILPVLFLVMFLVMVGFGIIIPVLPFLAEEVGGTPTQLGLLMAVYSLMQLIFAPIWGKISDRIGRKPVMLIGIFGLALSFFIMAIANSLWIMFVARIIGGILSSANMPTTMAYVADITTEEDRGKGMGIIGAATGLGFIFGPAIGGILSKSSLNTPFLIAGILSTLTFLLVLIVLKESLTAEQLGKQSSGNKSMWMNFSGAASILFVLQCVVSLSMAGLEATFAYFAANKAGIDTVQLGYIFMIMGFGSAIVQGGLIGIMTKKWGEGRVIQIGLIVSIIGFILILFTNSFWTATLFITIFGLGNGLIRPAVTALLTKTSTGGHGSSTGLLSSFDSLGRIIGPPLGGLLYSFAVGLPYISGAILTVGALLLYQVYHAQARKVQAL